MAINLNQIQNLNQVQSNVQNQIKQAVRGVANIYDGVTKQNYDSFNIKQKLKDVSTAIPVIVKGVQAGGTGVVGYVDVLPLVTGVSGNNEAIQPVTLYHLPYFRLQGGKAAVICDPVIDDIGLAVFAQTDTSTVKAGTKEPQQPGSKRRHSMSDGWYIGGFLNQAPSLYIELTQDNTVVINASGGVTINGSVTVNGDVVANGISLTGHTHPGDSGGTTGGPQ